MSVLDELGDHLVALGIGVLNVNLMLGTRPDEETGPLLTLYQYPGSPPEYVQNSHNPIAESPRIQVVARAIIYQDAESLIYRAWWALSGITNADLGLTRYRSVRPDTSPALMGRDATDRILMFFNAVVNKEVTLAVVS